MTYIFPVSVLILMMLGTPSSGMSSTFESASAPAMAAGSTPIVESTKAGDEDEDDIPIVPNP